MSKDSLTVQATLPDLSCIRAFPSSVSYLARYDIFFSMMYR